MIVQLHPGLGLTHKVFLVTLPSKELWLGPLHRHDVHQRVMDLVDNAHAAFA